MKSVAIKELKENLAYWTDLAAQGEMIEVTKYNHAYIRMIPVVENGLSIGKDVGRVSLKAVGKNLSRGKWLKYLEEDRG
ncbi:MAG: hypothetical protein HQM15_09340 [Deltaproteobacteria bacterium]|nr:hypothetical protein [Deltaproteobacteria bacterium]